MKVAHVIKSLSAGGVESWLKDLSTADSNELHYLLHDNEVGFFENEIKANGVKVDKSPISSGILRYSIYFFRYLSLHRIDVVHCHTNLSSGWFLFIAFLANVKIRVAHCHNDKRTEYVKHSFLRKLYYFIMKVFVHFFSNKKISVSSDCAGSMFFNIENVHIIPCGLSFSSGMASSCSDYIKLVKKDNEFSVFHIGRFVDQKNHDFIIELARSFRFNNRIVFYLVGDGLLKAKIRALVEDEGLKNVVFLGLISNVVPFLRGNADLFILPSKFEGLGLVAVESQVACVRTIVSDNLPRSVNVSNFIEFLPLELDMWVSRITHASENILSHDYKHVDYSSFDIKRNVLLINEVYQSEW